MILTNLFDFSPNALIKRFLVSLTSSAFIFLKTQWQKTNTEHLTNNHSEV